MFYSSTWYLKRRYFDYRGKRFMMNEGLLRTPMIHIYGKNDHFLKVLRTHELFENAVCVMHEEGHKITSNYTAEQQATIDRFILAQINNQPRIQAKL